MTGGIEDDAVGLSLERGGGYWYVLLNSSGVEERKKVSRLGGV